MLELTAAVEQAYRVFGKYHIGNDLAVCHCNCCMTEAQERELVTTPLRLIPSGLLAEYTNSAHGYDCGRIANELRYFLPRYFELIAAGDPPDHMGLDICLRRLGPAGYRTAWSPTEAAAIDDFLDAFVVASLPKLELAQWPAGWRPAFSIIDVLTMAVTAGCDIDRVLQAWDAAADPAAAIHMAALRPDVVIVHGRTYVHSAYFEDHQEAADKIGAWLIRPSVSSRIEATFFAEADPRVQQILSDGLIQLA